MNYLILFFAVLCLSLVFLTGCCCYFTDDGDGYYYDGYYDNYFAWANDSMNIAPYQGQQ